MRLLARISIQHPLLVGFMLLCTTVVLATALPTLQKEFGYRVLLGGDHPAIERLEGVLERFGGGFPAYIVWRCGDGAPCESVFDESSLLMAERIEQAVERVDGVRGVTSAASATVLTPSANGFSTRRWADIREESALEQQRFFDDALESRLWRRQIVSADGRTAAVVIRTSDARDSTSRRLTDAVLESVKQASSSGWNFHFAGEPIESVIAGRDLAASTASLTPVIAVVVASIVLLLTRSWQATATTMIAMGMALLWTFGFLAWLSWPQDSIFEVLAPLIMTIGTCDAVHLLSRTQVKLAPGAGRDEIEAAILSAAAEVGPACLMTSTTTAVALASFATSNLDTFIRFGVVAAFGTLACLVITFTLIPVLAAWLSLAPTSLEGSGWRQVLESIAETAEHRARPILVATGVVVAICAVGTLVHLRVETNIGEMYGDQNRVARWTHFIERHLRGMESLEIDLALPAEETILEPASQERIAKMIEILEAEPPLGTATSIRDILSELNRALHNGDPEYDRLSDSVAGNAELLELASSDSPELLDAWITPDWRHIRISVEAASDDPTLPHEFATSLRSELEGMLPPDWEMTLTGSFVLDYEWTSEVQKTQMRSFGTAFGVVLVLVSFFLRSVVLGMIAMLPAVIPVVLSLGFMGWTDLPLDVGRLMIAAVVVGIGVDDSIHLLSGYRVQRAAGSNRADAIRIALTRVGRALIITSISLSLGFVALTLSAWQTISSFGFFVCMAILGALVATLFVVPAVFFASTGGEAAAGKRSVQG